MNYNRMIRRVASAHMRKLAQEKPASVMFAEAVIDKRDLLNWFQDQTGLDPESMGWTVAAHHMTIEFFDKKEKKALKAQGKAESNILAPYKDLIGKSVVLDLVGYAKDDKGMAVLVEPKGPLARLVKNADPHITIATNGVGAKYSNELLAKGEIIPARGSIQARVGWKDARSGEDMFELPWDFGQ
jgi:hypothetical protein